MSLDNVFSRPIDVNGAGRVYPVRLMDWDEFEDNLNPLLLTKQHLQLTIEEDLPLLDRIVIGLQNEQIVESLCRAFNIVFRSKKFDIGSDDKVYFFINENNQMVTAQNYEEIRKVIFHQNILFEPKVYKTKAMQEWAEKVLKARSKNAANISLEDMITTVSVFTGKHYWDLEKYSIYQLKSDFNRIEKVKVYDATSISFANPYAKDIKLEHFAEHLNLYQNPYENLFKPKENLKISKAIRG